MDKKNNMDIKYTTILHDVRKELKVSFIGYCILDSISKTQKNGYSYMSKKYLSDWLGVSEKTIFDTIKTLEDNQYIERGKSGKLKVPDNIVDILIFGNTMKKVHSEEEKTMKKLHTDYEETSYNNNIYNNNINNIVLSKDKTTQAYKKNFFISVIKNKIKKDGFVYDSSTERIFIGHLLKNKSFLEIAGEDIDDFIISILEYANNNNFWKGKINSCKTFYYNWNRVYNDMIKNKPIKKQVSSENINNFLDYFK